MAELPKDVQGWHFGPELRAHIVYQNQFNRVPENKICRELIDRGIAISEGQVHEILKKATQMCVQEKDDLLVAGIQTARVLQTDDTGARHKGKNGYCTVICNDMFTVFKSSDNKSRLNFLQMLQGTGTEYLISQDCYDYLKKYNLRASLMSLICDHMGTRFSDEAAVEKFLSDHKIRGKQTCRYLKEGMLLAVVMKRGLQKELVLVSDGARQFHILNHALCWIHAVRNIQRLTPKNENERTEINSVEERIWRFYSRLKSYKQKPTKKEKIALSKEFDAIFAMEVLNSELHEALQNIFDNKDGLLKVLDYPETPLHNNTSERDIREYVTKRKISGGTRSPLGRKRRDVFTSLSKTCIKNKISFWNFLSDRISGRKEIPYLPELIRKKAQQLVPP